ncbi:hypothetical protein SAMN04487995_3995 [Dyadobacter koreensis]|uniref:Metallo-beta-lactamase domain-containing protein n=1 Tax=Dyadobacter koreensis TaxID=408657 RepID=A0A1H6XNC8_9BACT|nr:MBL fold metallo-hydrolase [Dyadobacter koreensis]SEJ29064.1 hypothetical protein SAMN04487995_3995 [Dyadobacter koreensis]
MMDFPIKPVCKTCGTQYPADQKLPELCTICNDDRQYITELGQVWIELESLSAQYCTKTTRVRENLYTLKIIPDFAITQRAFLVLSPSGNILWDCIPLLDEATTAFIKSKGGLKAIAFSHPHYYSNMNVWAENFNCPIYIHENDKNWVMYKSDYLKFWKGYSMSVADSEIINTGGHFPGSCILKIPGFSDKGVILSGDTLYISKSKRYVSVMYSFPNHILLSKSEFLSFFDKTKNLEFDTMYGAFEGQNLVGNAKEIFASSMQRYIESYGNG